jgi:hypothetical protein
LPALTRIYRTPKVLEERVTLSGYDGELRQITVMELGHEEPTVLLTNHLKLGPVELVTRYPQRMLIENGISEAVQFFHIDALSSMVGMKVDFDMQLTLMVGSLYRMMARHIGREYVHAQAKTIFRNLLDLSGKVEITSPSVVVTLDKRAHKPLLGRLRPDRSVHTHASVRQQKADHSIRLIGGLHSHEHAIGVSQSPDVEIEASSLADL